MKYIRGLWSYKSRIEYMKIVVKQSVGVYMLTVNESHICAKV
jgi:hypothetical protein